METTALFGAAGKIGARIAGKLRIEPGQTLRDLYDSRTPLYEKYAQVTVDCAHLHHEQAVAAAIAGLPG